MGQPKLFQRKDIVELQVKSNNGIDCIQEPSGTRCLSVFQGLSLLSLVGFLDSISNFP